MSNCSRLLMPLACLCLCAGVSAQAQEQQENIILSASPKSVQWAAVYKVLPERQGDPYFHVRVFEHQKGAKPWVFKELAFHMAVTPKALEASRISKKARIYSYKDVEIRSDYHRWLDDPATRSGVPVCTTDILSCIKRLPPHQ